MAHVQGRIGLLLYFEVFLLGKKTESWNIKARVDDSDVAANNQTLDGESYSIWNVGIFSGEKLSSLW